MPGRLTLEDLLHSRVPCTSSSWSHGIRSSEKQAAVASNVADHTNVRMSETPGVLSGNNRKRKGKAPEVDGEVKKRKVESKKDSCVLEGRLLLWNRTSSSHPGTGSYPLDCLAFCDGSSAVCCTVQDLDVELIGQYVQVNSWTFVPTINHSDKQCDAKDGSTGSENAGRRLKRTGCSENSKLKNIYGTESVKPLSLECGGCLEIHSLRLLDQPSVVTSQVLDFPALCLSPASANTRNLVLESPLEKIGKSKTRLRAWGLLQCISPPFLLPSKSSLQNAPIAADGRSLLGQSTQKSLFKDKSSSECHSDSQSMLGFLVELRACCHGTTWQPEYNQNDPSVWTYRYSQFLEQEGVNAGKDGTFAIYFSGAVASWRPLLGGMLGDAIAITGLRRKMIQQGPERKGFCIYVATRLSLVFRIPPTFLDSSNCEEGEPVRFSKRNNSNWLRKQPTDYLGCEMTRSLSPGLQFQARAMLDGGASDIAGQDLRSYVGKITSILMQGQFLELDDKVWLLLTHYNNTQVHGLRVGALVAVRHAHLVTLRSASEKVLVLGACLRSHVGVVDHSISNAGSRNSQVSQSRLAKYIRSLPFAWAFWVGHVISSLRCKFQGIYSDAQLLGSVKHAGLIRKVLPSMVATPVTLRRDAFKEFLLHEQFCPLGGTSASILLSKVPPLSNFCKHVEMLWVDPVSSIWHVDHFRNDGNWEFESKRTGFCKPIFLRTPSYVRNIISGVKLGVVLVGSLKVCQSTGKLQLVDATGGLDVIVPDLRSFSNLHCFYQIDKYELVMEGAYKSSAESAYGKSDTDHSPLSWSSLLKGLVTENRIPQSLSYYVKFYLRYAKRLEGLAWSSEPESQQSEVAVDRLSASDVQNDPVHVWRGKEFHIALITHKYPARVKFSPDKEKEWVFDVEVVLLPYSLLIHQDDFACTDTLNPPSQTLDFNSSEVQGAIAVSNHVTASHRRKLEEFGAMRTRPPDSVSNQSGCVIECCVRCLVEQSSGLKTSHVQSFCSLSASLFTRGCSASTSISGSYCATTDEHWAILSAAKLQKVVLSVGWRAIEFNQLFNTGDWCLLPTLPDKLLAFNSSEFKRVEIDAKQPLIGLQWRFATDGQQLQPDSEHVQQTVSSWKETTSACILPNSSVSNVKESPESSTEIQEETLTIKLARYSDPDSEEMRESTMSSPHLVDAVLTLPNSFGDEFRLWLASLKSKLIPPLLNVSEALHLSPHRATILPNRGSKLGEICDILNGVRLEVSSSIHSLQGQVVSVKGKLEKTEWSDDPNTADADDLKESSFPRSSGRMPRKTTAFQLRDLHTDQSIRIDINFDKYVRPLGFGPGAVACFRRILLRRDGTVVGMPTTDVFVESIEKRVCNSSHESQEPSLNSLPSPEQEGCAENVTALDLLNDFICELEPRKKYLKVRCRVVSVQGFELEWQISRPLSAGKSPADILSVQENIAVKWGCFVIDDGSAVAECWANGDHAANFLGFRGLTGSTTASCPSIVALAQYSSVPSGQRSALGASLPQVLVSLVRKYKRISVQGEPAQGDTGTTSWLVKGVDCDLQEGEATVLRLVLEQACQLGPKVVHCTTMSDKHHIFKYAQEYHRRQTCFAASTSGNSRPWQNLSWNRTQLVATKVEALNTWVELQQLSSSFDF